MAALVKNGITIQDLEKEWHDGFNAGFREASPGVVKTVYAAVFLTLHERLGFGQKRACEFMQQVDQHVIYTLNDQEAVDEVYDKLKLTLNFNETFDRVEIVDEAKPWRKKHGTSSDQTD